ncbi:MAG: c-type cytochrome [Gemmatimonadota bacterium]
MSARAWFPEFAAFLALSALACLPSAARAQDADNGGRIYDRWCAECHGAEGLGDGPAAAYMLPRPRDFSQARYQIRTTANGELPTDADILAILENGMPGTTMPAWPNLSGEEKSDVIAYLKSLSRFFDGTEPQMAVLGSDPGGGAEAIESGRAAYESLECWKCHGRSGRGSGQSTPTLEDWREYPIRAADLTEPWTFNGGGGAEEIHTRMLTGLDGTPMPAYSDALEAGVVSEEEVWNVAHYVASLAPTLEPRVADLVLASRVEGELPTSTDDAGWETAESYFVPLVGQIIETPRNFAPTVDGAWVQALHDGHEIALRVSWGDPSDSPDPEWEEWRAKLIPLLHADGADLSADSLLTDGMALQFPAHIPDGSERPYFLMGESSDPVTLWTWDSRSGVAEAQGRGLGNIGAVAETGLSGSAAFDEGRWSVVFRRPIQSQADGVISLAEGVAIPMAMFAWDGSSAETAARGSISSWTYLYLEEPASSAVFIAPLLAALLTAMLGWAAVSSAQRKARSSQEHISEVMRETT